MRRATLAIVVVLGWLCTDAHAYPQFQLSRDQMCTSCHLSPAGGGLLNENGLATAEMMSQLGHAPEFFYGKVPTPKWLTLGGDVRGAAGYLQTPTKSLVGIPMQIEGYGSAKFDTVTIHANVGARASTVGNEAATYVWSREHYLMWQAKPRDNDGVYVRLGRFMPVYGLRLAEHPAYVRRYGGTPLYADTYALHGAFVSQRFEAHVTGFIKDPLIDVVDHSSGGMVYGEFRPNEVTLVGIEGMVKRTVDDTKFGGGVIGKRLLGSKLLVQAELQYVSQVITKSSLNKADGNPLQLIGYVLASYFPKDWLMIDVGLGHYDSNIRTRLLDRDCIDLNIHWFVDSHIELIFTNRYEMLSFGQGGPSGAYSLMQLHYRL
ncbi:MAG: hypothetical protein H0T46_24455 [Deltaproteobacteria bacterium]|nr:hypothetical protein [Deltaproteobacteria bacterium]